MAYLTRPADYPWVEHAEATAAAAIATRAGSPSGSHVLLSVHASYSTAQVGVLTVKYDNAVVAAFDVHNQRDITLPLPLRTSPSGKALSAELSAGSTGVTGRVTMLGLTQN